MNNPKPEFRIKSLEKRVTTAEAGIEELVDGLQTIQQDIKKLDEGIKASYLAIGDALNLGFSNVEAMRQDLASIKATQVEHTQRLDKIDTSIAELKTAQTEQGNKLDQILELLKRE
jgi:uncharacterized coiled-coil protein SlyX